MNSNATRSTEFAKSDPPELQYIRIQDLTREDHGTIVNFRATVHSIDHAREELKVVNVVQQRSETVNRIYFWQEKGRFQQDLKKLQPGMYCAFQGIRLKKDGKLSADLFAKIQKINFNRAN